MTQALEARVTGAAGPAQEASSAAAARLDELALPEIVIRPPGRFAHLDVGDLWRFRGTLLRKTKARVRVVYDDMWLGFFWAVARPVIMVLVFWAFRGLSDAKVGVTIPYPLYVYAGLVAWFWFSEASVAVAGSLNADAGVLQKVYFPRLISPLSLLLAESYNLLLAAGPLVVFMGIFREFPGWQIVLAPLVLVQLATLALGVGLVFSSLMLSSRDWDRVLKFSLYLGLWLSPVVYAGEMIPERHRWLFELNPMTGTLDAVRAVLFGHYAFPWAAWGYACAVTVVVLVLGVLMFQRSERTLMDRL